MPFQLLAALNEAATELPRIEAKRASRIGPSILETACAFANEPGLGGGHLLLGVEKAEDLFGVRYEAVGAENAEKLQEDLVSQARSTFNRPLRLTLNVETQGGVTLVGAFVPEAAPADKPVFFKAKGLPAGAFRRYGTSDVACTDEDLEALFVGRTGHTYDASVVPGATLDDLDAEAIADYRRLRAEKDPDAEELRDSDEDLLFALHATADDNRRRRVPTVAGLLLFGTRRALQRYFPLVRVDYLRIPGNEWVEDPENRFTAVELRGPLLSVVRRAEAAIVDDLPRAFHLPEGDLQRTDLLPIPRRVLREAIVNALMHRSYRQHSPVQILRYGNRIEIVNPGYSLKPRERLGERRSETRNPHLAGVFHATRLAETRGSGIAAMRRLLAEHGLAPPTFESDRTADEFSARFLLHHFLGPDDVRWLAAFADLALTDAERLALVFVREVGALDHPTYREVASIDAATASASLRRLCDADVLTLKGRGAGTHFLPGPRLMASLRSAAEASNRAEVPSPLVDKVFDTGGEALSIVPPALSTGGEASAPAFPALPNPLRARVDALGTWTRKADLETLMVDLCAWRPLSAVVLAALLGNRNVAHLINRQIRPLVQAGRLARLYPDMPRHPRQAYFAPGSPADPTRVPDGSAPDGSADAPAA